eukprot:s719_g32.t1
MANLMGPQLSPSELSIAVRVASQGHRKNDLRMWREYAEATLFHAAALQQGATERAEVEAAAEKKRLVKEAEAARQEAEAARQAADAKVKTEAEKAAEAHARAEKASCAISLACQFRFKIRQTLHRFVFNIILFSTYKMDIDQKRMHFSAFHHVHRAEREKALVEAEETKKKAEARCISQLSFLTKNVRLAIPDLI